MSVRNLLDPIVDQGIRNSNYFEGRLLTAQDLRDQQAADRERARRLGRAIGTGIIEGLDVVLENDGADGSIPVVTVRKGLALNGEGEIIGLPLQDVQVALSRGLEAVPTTEADFYACAGPPDTRYLPNGAGVYLLLMAPAAGYKERAPRSGLGDAGIVKGCGSRYVQEGVKFRLAELTPEVLAETDPELGPLLRDDLLGPLNPAAWGETARLSLLRNVLAYQRLREDFQGRNALPLALRRGVSTDEAGGAAVGACEVPVAMIYWTLGGIAFIDRWSARRMLAPSLRGGEVERGRIRGMERLQQFSEQVDWLLGRLGAPTGVHVTDFFRFLPAGGFLPVRAAGVTGGFRANEFLAGFFRGGPTPATQGQGARLLTDSLVHEYFDLAGAGQLQRYLIAGQDGMPADAEANRRYEFFVSRDLYGPLVGDDAAEVLEDAWEVYRGLIRRQVFLPPAVDGAALAGGNTAAALSSVIERIAARETITEAIRAVLDVANRYTPLAQGADLDLGGAVRAYGAMYAVQDALATLFAGAIPGIDDTQERELFAAAVDQYLNHGLPAAQPSFKTALDSGSLDGAIAAQIEINRFVGSWSGEGVATGPFGFAYSRSPEGVQLVPGAPRIPQVFTLSNGTNRTLTMLLGATARADTGDWSDATRILGAVGGAETDRATLASGASREIVVMVGAPGGSAPGEAVTLTLTATVGPPTSRVTTQVEDTLLSVAEAAGEPVAGHVEIAGRRFNPLGLNPANISPNQIFQLLVSVTYSAGDATPRDFSLDLTATAGDASAWAFRDETDGSLLPLAGNVYTLAMDGIPADGSPVVGRVRIQAPARNPAADRTVTMSLSVRSVGLPSPIAFEFPQPVTLVVQSGP